MIRRDAGPAAASQGAAFEPRPGKLLAPAAAEPVLARPLLEARLDEGRARRLTVVVAGAGFGKSTSLASWANGKVVAWYTLSSEDADPAMLGRGILAALAPHVPEIPAELIAALSGPRGPDAGSEELVAARSYSSLLAGVLERCLTGEVILVLDDLGEIGLASPAAALVEQLCREAPAALRLVLASRTDPPFPLERLRGQGQVTEITAKELAFSPEETRAFATVALGLMTDEVANALHEITSGWPVAVRLVCEALRRTAPVDTQRALTELRAPGSPLFGYLAGEVLAHEGPGVRAVLRVAAPLDRFTPQLCGALGFPVSDGTLRSLAKRGLFIETDVSSSGWFRLTPLAREFVLEHLPFPPPELREIHRRAAEWFVDRGDLEEALGFLEAAGDEAAVASFLRDHGEWLISAGAATGVLRAAQVLGPGHRGPAIERLAGEAHQTLGDWDTALACFLRAAPAGAPLPAAVAWRLGLIHYLRGDLDEAEEAYARGRLDEQAPHEEAMLLGWRASLDWLRGDGQACRGRAEHAYALATRADDPRALAVAHTALALAAALEGDRAGNSAQYVRALAHAERAGDVLQTIRIRTNRGSRLLEEGCYEEAREELEVALELSQATGFAFLRGLALVNRGTVSLRLGRFEEAMRDLEAARAADELIGSSNVTYATTLIADVRRERGERALARAGYEEAVTRAEKTGDLQALVPALAGLARVLSGEEPELAEQAAERAVALGFGMADAEALLAAATVALERDDRERASTLAAQAGDVARSRRDRAGLAEALELTARSAPDGIDSAAVLDEAIAIWRELASPVGEARATLALALIAPPETGEELARNAARDLRAVGARGLAGSAAAALARLRAEQPPALTIQTLGGFRVYREGELVTLAEWRSKKARDLLKLLVTRRGSPLTRDAAMEALWPEGDPAKLTNRLSVALSTLRGVLDPARAFAARHYVVAEAGGIRLDLDHADVDLERFLTEADKGLRLHRAGKSTAASVHLSAADAGYVGDFLEEDPYEDWAAAPREQARLTFGVVAKALAEDAIAAGDLGAAVRYLLRALEKDVHDERAHLTLVSTLAATGRHGDARRAYATYSGRMSEIGVEPSRFPT